MRYGVDRFCRREHKKLSLMLVTAEFKLLADDMYSEFSVFGIRYPVRRFLLARG